MVPARPGGSRTSIRLSRDRLRSTAAGDHTDKHRTRREADRPHWPRNFWRSCRCLTPNARVIDQMQHDASDCSRRRAKYPAMVCRTRGHAAPNSSSLRFEATNPTRTGSISTSATSGNTPRRSAGTVRRLKLAVEDCGTGTAFTPDTRRYRADRSRDCRRYGGRRACQQKWSWPTCGWSPWSPNDMSVAVYEFGDLIQEGNLGLMRPWSGFSTDADSSSPPMRCGGPTDPSRGPSRIRPSRFVFRSTWSRRSIRLTALFACAASSWGAIAHSSRRSHAGRTCRQKWSGVRLQPRRG